MLRPLAAWAVLSAAVAFGPDALADDAVRARAAFDRANAAYEAGDVKGALREMTEAHRLSRLPALLYNVAKLERELGQCRPALDDYRRYLAEASSGPSADAAGSAATQLDAECGHSRPAYWNARRVIGWSAIAASAVAGTTAIYFSVAAHDAAGDVEESLKRAQREHTPYAGHDREMDGQRDQVFAGAFAAAAGVFATGGVLLLVLGHPGSEQPPAGVSVSALPGGGAFSYSARF